MAPTSRSARYAKWLSIPLGLAISALLIWQASYAAFTDTASTDENSWTTGTMDISHDHEGVAVFEAKDLVPGDTGTKTVEVDYSGSLDAELNFFAKSFANDRLAEHIWLTIEATNYHVGDHEGTWAPVFEGTLLDFATKYDEPGTTIQSAATAGDRATLDFTYEVMPEARPGTSATITFVAQAKSLPKSG